MRCFGGRCSSVLFFLIIAFVQLLHTTSGERTVFEVPDGTIRGQQPEHAQPTVAQATANAQRTARARSQCAPLSTLRLATATAEADDAAEQEHVLFCSKYLPVHHEVFATIPQAIADVDRAVQDYIDAEVSTKAETCRRMFASFMCALTFPRCTVTQSGAVPLRMCRSSCVEAARACQLQSSVLCDGHDAFTDAGPCLDVVGKERQGTDTHSNVSVRTRELEKEISTLRMERDALRSRVLYLESTIKNRCLCVETDE